MTAPKAPAPEPAGVVAPMPINSTTASPKAEREAQETVHGPRPRRSLGTFHAGIDAENPILTVTHVRA